MLVNGHDYQYLPLLSISLSEMRAVEELPEKVKDEILPLFPLKGWMSAKTLDKAIERVERSFNKRPWITDIDSDFLEKSKREILVKEEARAVFHEIVALADSTDGYRNWCDFISSHDNLIPCIQTEVLTEVEVQISRLKRLGRRVVVYLKLYELNSRQLQKKLDTLENCALENEIFVIDVGDIDSKYTAELPAYLDILKHISDRFPECDIAVASTSFPYSFSGQRNGEASIYERQLFQSLSRSLAPKKLTYADHGSTRAGRMSGGSGTPPPRIDYALKIEWKFIREEFEDSRDIQEGEKHGLYKKIANEMIAKDYWIENLKLWGTQMIELTAQGDSYGITSAQDATAVRINLHLYQQLNYENDSDSHDTDEDWVD